LQAALKLDQNNLEVLQALATINRDRGNWAEAEQYAKRLIGLQPDNPALRELLKVIQKQRAQNGPKK
jgi:cytochrome c-type biogenesis protein CcmH/NrfG